MNATVDDLIATIGEQQVELRMMRKQNNELAQALKGLRDELKQYEDQDEDKEKKGK